jgi:hypothetical protein
MWIEEVWVIPDVRNIVELSNDGVPDFGTVVSVCFLDLGTEVTQDDDGWLVWTDKNRSDEKLKVFCPFFVPIALLSVRLRSSSGNKTHGWSSASKSSITRSVESGRWCALQNEK